MPGRTYSSESEYRYGFNGKENDKDAGAGVQDYGMRIYDSRLGKFLSTDPLFNRYSFYSPYQFAGNTTIQAVDVDGEEPQAVIGFIVGALIEIGQQTISNGFDNVARGESFFSKWSEKIDWADVTIAAVSGALNTVLPGAGQAMLAERAAGYAITENFSNMAKSAVDYTVETGNQNIFDGSKDLDKFKKDMIVNTASSLLGAAIPLTATKPILQKSTSTLTGKAADAAGEVILNVPKGGLTSTTVGLIVDQSKQKPIASPPSPPKKSKAVIPKKIGPTPKPIPKKEKTSSSDSNKRIYFSFINKNGQEETGDVPDNDYGRKQLNKIKDFKIIN